MSSTGKAGAWYRNLRWVPGVVVSGLALWLVLRQITWQTLAASFAAISPGALLEVFGFYMVALFLRVFCWYILLQRRVRFWRVFFVMNEGYLLNNVFPLRVGELGRAVLLSRDGGMGFFQVLSSVVSERIFDLAIASSMLLATLPLALKMDWAKPAAVGVFSAVLVGLVTLFFLARNRQKVIGWLTHLGSRWKFFIEWALPKIDSLLEGFSVLTNPGMFALSLLAMALSWLLAVVRDYLVLGSLVPGVQFWWVALALSAGALGAGLPSVAGALGVYEAAVVGTLALLGVPQAPALAYAIVIHAMQILLSSSMGLAGLLREGENVTGLYRSLVARQ